jgi:hypothetical protein
LAIEGHEEEVFMILSLRKWPVALLAAPLALCLASGLARAQTFDEPLEKCQSVTTPAPLTTCAAVQDPLAAGGATISNQGDVTVTVIGAATNTKYSVSFVSNDGTQTLAIDSFKTGAGGNGGLRKDAFFKFGTVGAGNIVLTSTSGEEFVTGLTVAPNGIETRRDFQPGMVRCTDVTVPGALGSCGSDSLAGGRIFIEEDDGALLIHVSGARPSTSYTASLVSPGGTVSALGTVGPTNGAGGATLVNNPAFPASTIASGEVVLQSGGTTEFVSGFKVDEKFVRPKVSASSLEPCGSVTDPVLANCGSDPLDEGSYKVEAGGQVSVTLSGANPSTNYELFFRPLDDSGDQDTGIAIATNALGNAKTGLKKYFSTNTIAAGTFVVKHPANVDTLDQFVSGYEIH